MMARVKISNGPWHDCPLPDDIIMLPGPQIAKAAIESWWRVSANYRGTYNVDEGRVRDCSIVDDIFTCGVDNGRTPLTVDLSQAGGPW